MHRYCHFYIAFGNALAALGEQLGKAKKIDSIALGSLNIIRTANPSDLNSNEDCFRGFKEALVNMLTTGSLYTRTRVQPNSLSGQELVARMIDDVYTFLLAHELRHIGMYGKESFSGTVAEWTTEFDADGWALSVTVSSSSVQNDTLSVYSFSFCGLPCYEPHLSNDTLDEIWNGLRSAPKRFDVPHLFSESHKPPAPGNPINAAPKGYKGCSKTTAQSARRVPIQQSMHFSRRYGNRWRFPL